MIIFHQVQLLNNDGSVAFECQLKEKALDPKGNDSRILPPYNAYSAQGEIEVGFIHSHCWLLIQALAHTPVRNFDMPFVNEVLCNVEPGLCTFLKLP